MEAMNPASINKPKYPFDMLISVSKNVASFTETKGNSHDQIHFGEKGFAIARSRLNPSALPARLKLSYTETNITAFSKTDETINMNSDLRKNEIFSFFIIFLAMMRTDKTNNIYNIIILKAG